MSTVEERLREALRERASQSPVSPDAWPKTVARASRARVRERRGWSRFGIPAAAAAAVAAIVAGSAVLAGGLGTHGASSPTAPPSATPPPSPGPGDYEMQSAPPVTAVVRVRLTVDGQTTWTYVWFGYLKNDRAEGLAMCTVTYGDGYGGGGGCGPQNVPAHQVGHSNGPYGSITMGTSLKQVTAVSARLADGRTVPGVVVSGRGFPYKFWAVVRPASQNAQIIFRGAGGAELGHLAMAAQYPVPPRPRTGGIVVFRYPAGTQEATAGTMTAYLLDGRVIGSRGKVVGFWDSDSSSVISGVGPSWSSAVVSVGGDYTQGATEAWFYGYARQNVARVVLRLADGRQYGAPTIAGWAGSGLRLWAFAVPTRYLAGGGQPHEVLTGYDAAGHVVAQVTLR
jgi:hypothetical protein